MVDARRRSDELVAWVSLSPIILSWLPAKSLAYAGPWVLVAALILLVRNRRVAWRALAVGAVVGAVLCLYALFEPGFKLEGALIGIFTYGVPLALIIVPARALARPGVTEIVQRWCAKILAIESVLGLVQAGIGFAHSGTFDVSNGDWVKGTIGLTLHGFIPGRGFGNAMFAANLALLLLLLLPRIVQRRRYLLGFLGALALVLASVVHVLLFLLVAGGISAVIVLVRAAWVRVRTLFAVGFAALCIISLAVLVLPQNLELIGVFAKQFAEGQSPKAEVVRRAVIEMPASYPWMPWVGLGPGQFSSRAGLIATGRFFGGYYGHDRTPGIVPVVTGAQQKYLMDLWAWAASTPYFGTTQHPYFSWLSAYTELGIPACLGILLALTAFSLRVRRLVGLRKMPPITGFALVAAFVFVFLLGLQENYWEIPQAIVPILLFKQLMVPLRESDWQERSARLRGV